MVLFGYREPSLVYYLERPVTTCNSPKELTLLLDTHGEMYTLLRDRDREKIAKQSAIIAEPLEMIDAPAIAGLPPVSVQVVRLRIDRALPVAAETRASDAGMTRKR